MGDTIPQTEDERHARADEEARLSLPKPDWDERQNRIEALRAASRIVAGIYAGGPIAGMDAGPLNATKEIAEQFAKWLEKGEINNGLG